MTLPSEGGALTSFRDAMKPRTHEQAWRMCQTLAQSSVCPKSLQNDPMAIMVCIEAGERFGFSVLQSMQSIAVINGRPTLWGDAALAACKGSSVFASIEETASGDPSKAGYQATCKVLRKGDPNPVARSFTYEDAALAGLLGKQGPWRQYPKRMFQMRARAFALRDAFPDVLSGMQIREEVEDYAIDVQTGSRVEKPDPARTMNAKKHMSDDAAKHLRLLLKGSDTPEALEAAKGQIVAYEDCALKDHLKALYKEQRDKLALAAQKTQNETNIDDMGYDLPEQDNV